MKIGLDENVSRRMAEVVAALDQGNEILHLPRIYGHGAHDIPLVTAFVADGGEILIGGDYKMTARPHELARIMDSGLRLYVMPRRWSARDRYWKAGFLQRWWGMLVQHAEQAPLGSVWQLAEHWEAWNPSAVRRPPDSAVQPAFD